jgi:hypothetical protein
LERFLPTCGSLQNQAVHTDREVTANRPDIIIKNKKEKTCTLINVTIPADRNVAQKEAENTNAPWYIGNKEIHDDLGVPISPTTSDP